MVKMRTARAGGKLGRQNSHPGSFPACEQTEMEEAVQKMVDAEKDDKKVFDLGAYNKLTRSQQIDAQGILANTVVVLMWAMMGTGLRFLAKKLATAVEEVWFTSKVLLFSS